MISQYVLKLVLEPIAQLRRTKAEVSSTVLFRQRKIANGSFHEKAAEELQRLASRLRANVSEISCYAFLSRISILGLPTKDKALKACHELNLLAYNTGDPSKEDRGRRATENWEACKELGRPLDIETMYTERSE